MTRKKTISLIEDFSRIPEEALIPKAEQPYPIPKHWKWVKFQSLNRFSSRTIDPSKYPNEKFELYSVPSFTYGLPELTIGKEIGSIKQRVTKNDILVCKINPRINRVWTITHPGNYQQIASSEWIVFRPSFGYAKYFEQYFASPEFRKLLTSRVSGVGGSLTRARPKDVASYPVPLPPLKEQELLVEKLLKNLQKIDAVTEQLQKFLDGSESRTESLLNAALQGRLTDKWRSQHNQQRKPWKSTTLGQAFKWSSGGTPSRRIPNYYTGDIPWVKSGELLDRIIESTEEHITDLAIKNSSAKIFPKGSVAIAMYGATIGKVGILGIDAATNQAIAVAQCADHTLERFLFFYLRANRKKFIALGKGGAQPNISQQVIKAFPYELPSIPEQREILHQIDLNLNTLSNAEELVKEALINLHKSRSLFISAAMAGRININFPSE